MYARSWVVPPAIVAVLALPFAGHAAAVEPAGGAIFTDAVHVLSAGIWAGGIVVLATLRPPEGWGRGEGIAMLQRFGRVAFLAFAITALTGVVRATQGLGEIGALWSTTYGLVLMAKTVAVLVMVVMSWFVWTWEWRHARLEGLVVLVVLALTALLAVTPITPYFPRIELLSH
jgi:putative copper export protein